MGPEDKNNAGCGACAYFRESKTDYGGYCHRYAPRAWASPITNERGKNPYPFGFTLTAQWPEVLDHQWCGEWVAKQ